MARSVIIKRERPRWKRLPAEIRASIEAGVERVTLLREQIAASAKVQSRPPVQILDVGWECAAGVISGRSTILSVDGAQSWGVELPAPTVAFITDDTVLRLILVHEFLHCFDSIRRVMDHVDAGRQEDTLVMPGGDPFNAMHDCALLARPEDWFGPEDSADVLLHNDPRLERWTDLIALRWYGAGLPTIRPNLRINGSATLQIPKDLSAHVRSLREGTLR